MTVAQAKCALFRFFEPFYLEDKKSVESTRFNALQAIYRIGEGGNFSTDSRVCKQLGCP